MVVATNNEGKLKELRNILDNYEIYSLKDKGIDIDVVEDQDTFIENAKKKAFEVYNIVHEPTIADDSGICINALNGFPGVMTHRFLGDNSTSEQRNLYMINETNKYKDRSAKVICDLVYYDGNDYIIGEGVLEGIISKEIRGENGFGFDKILELSNGLTVGQLSQEEKNKISARYLAIQDLKQKLQHKKLLR